MKNKANKKRIAFILALVVLISAMSIGYFVTNAETTVWSINEITGILLEKTNDTTQGENYDALVSQAKMFSSELAAKLGEAETRLIKYSPVDYSGEKDIVIRYDESLGISEQGYSVYREDDRLIIAASDFDGLFYGCRYVVKQVALNSGKVNSVENEAPDVKERAFFLDIGRKYYTPDWIKGMIREISWSNMNTLILHFSEEMGLGLESQKFEWLVKNGNTASNRDGILCVAKEVESDNRYITLEEMADIIAYAKEYHVEIIPSFDSPGHMNYIVKRFNEKSSQGQFSFEFDNETIVVPQNTDIGNYFHYNNSTAIVGGSGSENAKSYSRGIDISNEIASAFTKSLIQEYAQFFHDHGCTKIDLGGDELLGWGTSLSATVPRWQQLDHWKAYAEQRAMQDKNPNIENIVAYDAFVYYMNDLYDLAYAEGYESMRMWNDDALRIDGTNWKGAVELNKNYEIEFWSFNGSTSVNSTYEKYKANGYNVLNYLSAYNYYVLKDGIMTSSYPKVTCQSIFENWNPYVFNPDSSVLSHENHNAVVGEDTVKGTAFLVWCDDPTYQTEEEVRDSVLPLIKANAAKAWDASLNSVMSFNQFESYMNTLGDYPTALPTAKEIYYVPDLQRLQLAVDAFAHEDPRAYTNASFDAYRTAIEECQRLLEKEEPTTGAEVDAALNAMRLAYAGLVPYSVSASDLKDLNDLINTFNAIEDSSIYTEESFRKYRNVVNLAKNMISKHDYTILDIHNSVADITCAYKNLALVGSEAENAITYAKLRTEDVNRGSVAILGVVTNPDVEIDRFKIVALDPIDKEDDGTRDIIKTIENSSKHVTYLYFSPQAISLNVDTVYAYSADGTEVGHYSFVINIV